MKWPQNSSNERLLRSGAPVWTTYDTKWSVNQLWSSSCHVEIAWSYKDTECSRWRSGTGARNRLATTPGARNRLPGFRNRLPRVRNRLGTLPFTWFSLLDIVSKQVLFALALKHRKGCCRRMVDHRKHILVCWKDVQCHGWILSWFWQWEVSPVWIVHVWWLV